MPPNQNVKFLLVDDLEPNLLALTGLLKRPGLELLCAHSGSEALELLLVHDVALAILDVQMPGIDGFELAELMRGTERTRRVPIIFLTAGAMDYQRRFRGYELGAVDFLFKPIEPHILRSKAEVFFELARQKEELRAVQQKLAQHAADLEATVADRTARLRETVQELEAYSYSIAHDMRAPLRGMHGFAQILIEDYSDRLDEMGKSLLHRITGSATRMDALIREVLNYTRVLRAEAPMGPVDLDQLLQDMIASYPHLQPVQAEIRVEGKMPLVLGHEAFLTQCMSNLLGNAVKFVEPGVRPSVRIWAEQKSGSAGPSMVRIWVEDNGIGIPEKDRDRVFRMFDRLHPAEQFEGTGIGLTIARKAAERMGGRIGFESEVNHGSKFWIELEAIARPDTGM